MKLKHSAMLRQFFAIKVFYGISVLFIMLTSGGLIWMLLKGPNTQFINLIAIFSCCVSCIALITTSAINTFKIQLQLAHTFHVNKDKTCTLIINNTSEVSISITSIYYHRWPIHNSVRQLLKIESGGYVEIQLPEQCLEAISETKEVSIETTLGNVQSQYFEASQRIGEEKLAVMVAKV